MSEKIKKIIDEISNLKVVELNELIKSLEEKFEISFNAFAPQQLVAADTSKEEVKPATVNIILVDTGANKINVIKVLRELNPNLSLKDAKDIVDNSPQTVAEKIDLTKAEELKKKFEEAGAKVEFK